MQLENDITATLDKLRKILVDEVVLPQSLQHKAIMPSAIDLLQKIQKELLDKVSAANEQDRMQSAKASILEEINLTQ